MTDLVAALLGLLSAILFLTAYSVVTGPVSAAISPRVNFMAFVMALILGLVVYVIFARDR